MVGKTIARVEEPGGDDYLESDLMVLWFTDGTAVKLRATGWETDGIEVEPTTAAELDQELVEACEAAIEREWTRHKRGLVKVHECMQMAAAYGGEDTRGYQRWYQNRYGLGAFGKALKREFVDGMRDQMNAAQRLHFGFYRGDHIG